jgi:N utilization substance protein B
MKNRRKSREIALISLYQYEVGLYKEPLKCLEEHLKNYPVKENIIDFAKSLLKGIWEELDYLNEVIQKYSKSWKLERILILDRNILRIAIYEMIFIEDIPYKVSINEAVEIAKMYSGEDSRIFINGILDKVFKKELLNKNGK